MEIRDCGYKVCGGGKRVRYVGEDKRVRYVVHRGIRGAGYEVYGMDNWSAGGYEGIKICSWESRDIPPSRVTIVWIS